MWITIKVDFTKWYSLLPTGLSNLVKIGKIDGRALISSQTACSNNINALEFIYLVTNVVWESCITFSDTLFIFAKLFGRSTRIISME